MDIADRARAKGPQHSQNGQLGISWSGRGMLHHRIRLLFYGGMYTKFFVTSTKDFVVDGGVGKDEDLPGQIGRQSLGAVVPVEDGWPPGEEIGIAAAELFPVGSGPPFDALMDQRDVGPGDRLVIEVRSAVMRGESFECRG